ncbi:unnamed protein product, partial [Trichobilharzia szidati]
KSREIKMPRLNLFIWLLLNGFVSTKRRLSSEINDTQHARKTNDGTISADKLGLKSDHPYYIQSVSYHQKTPIEFTKSNRVIIPADNTL